MTSHWTLEGEPLPYVPFLDGWEAEAEPPSFLSLYQQSFEADPHVAAAAAIAVEKIPEVLLIAGGDDRVWPSGAQAARIRARRDLHGLGTTVVADDQAGHRTVLPGEPAVAGGVTMARGGTDLADRRLGLAAWQHLERLLAGR
jgi:hypothetical protein